MYGRLMQSRRTVRECWPGLHGPGPTSEGPADQPDPGVVSRTAQLRVADYDGVRKKAAEFAIATAGSAHFKAMVIAAG